ncbi:MAG: chemotaxis protein CheD [Spirochaetales bacterium]
MTRIDVGIGDLSVTGGDKEIKTYALGSCVALVVWDSSLKAGGMVHIALPESQINPEKARDKPGYFADTGLPLLFSELKKLGANRKTCWVKMIGGSSILDENNTFDIGRRNALAVKKFLWKIGLALTAEDCGGNISRTVSLAVPTGELVIANGNSRWSI